MGFKISRLLIIRSSFGELAMPLLKEYIDACRSETDCLSIDLYSISSEQQLYVLQGNWKNEIAYLYHIDQIHYRRFLHCSSGMMLPIEELRIAKLEV